MLFTFVEPMSMGPRLNVKLRKRIVRLKRFVTSKYCASNCERSFGINLPFFLSSSVLISEIIQFFRYHKIHKEVYDWFGISFDIFGRTSTPQHTEVCHTIFKRLLENDGLFEGIEKQLFCEMCQGSLADRLVEGTCPTERCNNDSARGDQCDKCGKTYNSVELKEPRCKVCQMTN